MLAQPTVQKYRAKAVYWNLVTRTVVSAQTIEQYRVNDKLDLPKCIARFDSQHEFKVYLELVRMYGADSIIRQHPITIIEECCTYPKGKTWKIDFLIQPSSGKLYVPKYVEAKGAFLPEFATTLAFLEMTSPELFERLFIVFGNKLPSGSQVLKNLLKSSMKDNLLTLPELKDLSRLI
jgi:hypothetical protein